MTSAQVVPEHTWVLVEPAHGKVKSDGAEDFESGSRVTIWRPSGILRMST